MLIDTHKLKQPTQLLEELSGWKKENERNEYRIHILVRSLSDEQQKAAHLEEQLKHLSSKWHTTTSRVQLGQ